MGLSILLALAFALQVLALAGPRALAKRWRWLLVLLAVGGAFAVGGAVPGLGKLDKQLFGGMCVAAATPLGPAAGRRAVFLISAHFTGVRRVSTMVAI